MSEKNEENNSVHSEPKEPENNEQQQKEEKDDANNNESKENGNQNGQNNNSNDLKPQANSVEGKTDEKQQTTSKGSLKDNEEKPSNGHAENSNNNVVNTSALQNSQLQGHKPVKRRGMGSNNLDPNQIQEIHRVNAQRHWKKKLQNLVGSRNFDLTIIWLVILYTVLVFILFALDNDENDDNDDIQLVIKIVQYIEMAILIIFMGEIILKIIAVGLKEYFNDTWLLFDALVIVASVVLLILDFTLDNSEFSTISKILRGIFRFLRLFLVFRKVDQFKKIALTHSRFAQKTPVEAILDIMNSLKENVDDPKYIQEIDYAIEMISDNRLYEPIIQKGDQDAENWIGTYADPKKDVFKKKQNDSVKQGQNLAVDSNMQTAINQPSAQDIYNTIDLPQVMLNFFDKIDTLDFEVFELHKLGETNTDIKGMEVGYLLVYLLQRYDVVQKMKIDPQILFSFGNRIAGGYLNNHYHNKMHAFDVTQTVHFFMSTCDFINVGNLTPLEICTMYVAAACHDYEQGGLNNVYLINTRDKLAIRYNDKSPLENHHVSQAFFILKEQDNKYNFTTNFSKDDFKRFRDRMITMILATDMQNHFTDLAKLKGRLAAEFDAKEKDKPLCMEAILHAADVSNPIKPYVLYEQWANRVLNEFWDQGDKEREQGLPITYLCDRYTTNKSKSQMGFIDFIVKPYYETLKQFLPKLGPFLVNFETNKEEWKKQLDKWDENLKELCEQRDKEQAEQGDKIKLKK